MIRKMSDEGMKLEACQLLAENISAWCEAKSGSSGVIFWTKLDVGEMLRLRLGDGISCAEMGESIELLRYLSRPLFIIRILGHHLPCLFEGWMLIGFSSTRHTSSSSNIPPGPGYCSLPCYRVHAAGQCPARPDRELPAKKQKTQVVWGAFGGGLDSLSLQGHSTRGGSTPALLGISFANIHLSS